MSRLPIKFILRVLWLDGLNSGIKILGLAAGMTCALLAILFIRDENSFDRFHTNAGRLYRITTTINDPLTGGSSIMGATGQVQGPAFKDAIPEIDAYTRVMGGEGEIATNMIANDKPLLIQYIYADEGFFDIFSFPLLYGKSSGALQTLQSIVITERTARRFFGKTNVLGQTIRLEEGHGMANFTITGVAKDIPAQSSLQFEAVLPFKYMQTMFPDRTWLNSYLNTFVVLKPHANVGKIENEFGRIFRDRAAAQLREQNMDARQLQFGLQPLADVHQNIFRHGPSYMPNRDELSTASSLTYSYILGGIATLILIMAILNFLNLSIAGSLKRSKEIAVRKISGGSRKQIIAQFLAETSVLSAISYVLAIGLTITVLPVFNKLSQKDIHFLFPSDLMFFIDGLIIVSVCVLVMGLYPAIRLSLFNPVDILLDRQKIGRGGFFSKGLSVLQFTLAISLLIATVIYYRQMNFISQTDLGYDPSDIVCVHLPNFRDISDQTVEALRNRLNAEPSIIQTSNGDLMPSGGTDLEVNQRKITAQMTRIDPYFLRVAGMSLKEGRDFSAGFGMDSAASIIVNGTFVEQAGLQDPIGQQVAYIDDRGNHHRMTIIGVVRDYHYGSLKEAIRPVALTLQRSEFIWVKMRKGNVATALAKLTNTLNGFFPQFYQTFDLVDDAVRGQYASDRKWQQIIAYASLLSIIICCMGLIGLAHFETLRRTKEIAVRKVFGSSVLNISLLLSRDFMKLLTLSMLIGFPIAWYTMDRWLADFSYRIHISWLDFGISAFVVLMIDLLTVNLRAYRAAIASPLKSLRNE